MSKLKQNNTVALVVDIQARLLPAMYEGETWLADCEKLLKGLRILSVPSLITEQYPKGLGNTVEPIQNVVENAPIFEKTQFSAFVDGVQAALKNENAENVIVLGCETHVCVLQTVLDLREQGYAVYVPQECVTSRTLSNKNNALEQIHATGAVVSNIESVLFQLLGDAKHPSFKEISKLIQ